MKIIRITAALVLCLALTACSDFERATFKTLSASKAVIDAGQADYEAHKIPKTACTKALIEDAKVVQDAAVAAMVVYEEEKAAKTDITAQTAVVVAELGKLPALTAEITALYTNPASCGGAK